MLPVKKTKTAKRSPKSKRKAAPKSFADYLAGVPEHARGQLKQMRAAIRSVVPKEATETISYGIPAFQNDGVIVWFAAFSKHCSLFPTGAIIEAFAKELKGFSTSKGTVHFPVERPLPIGLIKRMVKARVAKVKSKKRA